MRACCCRRRASPLPCQCRSEILTATLPYRLGLPAWAFPGWKGRYFSNDQPMLDGYSRVFNAVEGNTTFYRTPSDRVVAGWSDIVRERNFRFCFKLPRDITHEQRADLAELRRFLRVVEPLGDALGPLFIQFPATVGPQHLDEIERLVNELPRGLPAVLEVRDPLFFSAPDTLRSLLDRYRLGRVVLDSRPLFQGDLEHPDVQAARHAKPDLPVLPEVYNGLEFVRLILHPDLPSNDQYLDEWATRIAASVRAGHESYLMIHCPNNDHCPALAAEFHSRLQTKPGMETLAALPAWPVPQQGRLL